jgi:hypothetical protein
MQLFEYGTLTVGCASTYSKGTVRVFGGKLQLAAMPLVPTPAHVKLLQACDQWHFISGIHSLQVVNVNFIQTLKALCSFSTETAGNIKVFVLDRMHARLKPAHARSNIKFLRAPSHVLSGAHMQHVAPLQAH